MDTASIGSFSNIERASVYALTPKRSAKRSALAADTSQTATNLE